MMAGAGKGALTYPVRLAQEMVRCPSVTPDGGDGLAVAQVALEEGGFACRRLDYGTPKVANLLAAYPSLRAARDAGGRHFCFAGHSDVVPAGDDSAWSSPPFAGVIKDGRLYGRGAVDMKGAVACMIAALRRYAPALPQGCAVSLLLTGDEEGEATDGTKRVLAQLAEDKLLPGFCLLGEPTGVKAVADTVKRGRRGSLYGVLTVAGEAGHSAYPERARNPIPPLLGLLAKLGAERWDEGSGAFDPTSLTVTALEAHTPADNVTAARAQARFNLRFTPLYDSASLERRLRAVLSSHGAGYRLEIRKSAEAFSGADDTAVAFVRNAVGEAMGRLPFVSCGGGTSDGRFIHAYCPVVEVGLCGDSMHKSDENVPLADLEALTRVYETVLRHFFERGVCATSGKVASKTDAEGRKPSKGGG